MAMAARIFGIWNRRPASYELEDVKGRALAPLLIRRQSRVWGAIRPLLRTVRTRYHLGMPLDKVRHAASVVDMVHPGYTLDYDSSSPSVERS